MERIAEYATVLVAVHGLALAIVNITPTPKDDEMVGKVYRAIEILAGLIGPLSKR